MESYSVFPIIASLLFAIWSAHRLYYYAIAGTSRLVWIATYIGVIISMGCILLIPFDIQSSLFYHNGTFLYYCWRTLYWTLQCLSWVVYPFTMEKELSGSWAKSIKRNFYWWMIYAIVGGFALIYSFLLSPHGFHGLIAVAYAASNAWGLLLIIILGGYGMAAAPRWLYLQSRPSQYMEYLYVKAVSLDDSRIGAKSELIQVYNKARSALESTDPDLLAASAFISKEYSVAGRLNEFPPSSQTEGVTDSGTVDMAVLLADAMQTARRANCCWKLSAQECLLYEDLYGETGIEATPVSVRTTYSVYMHKLAHVGLAILALATGLLSACIIFGQATIFVDIWWMSPLAAIFRKINWSDQSITASFFQQAVMTVPLLWLFYCCYWSLARLKVHQFYGLYPMHNTDSISLMWCASLLVRIAFPMVYNFILLLHVPFPTVFELMFGYLDMVPFMGKSVVLFFPFLIILVALLTITNAYARFMNYVGIDSLQFETFAYMMEPSERARLINEGRSLMRKERTAVSRSANVEMPITRVGGLTYARLQEEGSNAMNRTPPRTPPRTLPV